ncbi:MAG TPA: hypothetical protein DCR69_04390 [Clostridium sp.]|nr:hypothetical protein [Clostridium sp.]
MGTNSIKANLGEGDIISEIALSLGADIEHKDVFVIVEGEDDIKFWKGILNTNVTIIESFTGKDGIKKIIEENFNHEKRVVGVVDKDYDIDENAYKNIFYYDYSCMEMMLIKNDYAFNRICDEYYFGQLSSKDVRLELLNQLKYLSIIRKNNATRQLEIRFKGISLNNMFNKSRRNIENCKVIFELNKRNDKYFELNTDKLICINYENLSPLDYEELLNITQGHDFISLFNIFSTRKKGEKVKDKVISSSLRCAYRKEDFIDTILYSQLISYENEYNINMIS